MDVQRLADGLWRWTAPHPNAANWPDFGPPVPPEVGCVYYEALDAVVLIDPLLPTGEEEEFLAHLDRDIGRLGCPVSILLTAAWHERSASFFRERYRAENRIPVGVEVYPIEGAPEEQLAYFTGLTGRSWWRRSSSETGAAASPSHCRRRSRIALRLTARCGRSPSSRSTVCSSPTASPWWKTAAVRSS
jgi:hypothetical protein